MEPAASVARVLLGPLSRQPDREALVGRSGRLTYRALDAAADRVAGALWARGLRPGDVVAASLPNDVDIVVAFHAVMRLGGIWLGINRELAPPEQAYILGDAAARLLLADDDVAAGLAGLPAERRARTDVLAIGRGDLAAGASGWSGSTSSVDLDRLAAELDPHAPAALAYTSGTTGRPKGVVHSQHNLLVPGRVLVATRGYDAELRKGDCLPLTILNMIVLTTLLTAQCGGTCVVMDRRDAGGVAEWIRAERITTWNGVPAILSSLSTDPSVSPADLSSLDEVWCGGDHCPEAIERAFVDRFGLPLHGAYGLTEAPTVVSIDDRGEPRRAGASGRPLPHLRVTIRDDADRELPAGEVGEVWVEAAPGGRWARLYRPMLGYLHQPEASSAALRGGRLRTGDLGSVDGDGYLTIRSRRSALVIRGGANVYPAEVERVISEVAAVAGCVVFGVPDDRLGERVAAAIELHEGEPASATRAAVLARCAAELAAYKVPDIVTVVDVLPRNAMGKVDRAALAAIAAGPPLRSGSTR